MKDRLRVLFPTMLHTTSKNSAFDRVCLRVTAQHPIWTSNTPPWKTSRRPVQRRADRTEISHVETVHHNAGPTQRHKNHFVFLLLWKASLNNTGSCYSSIFGVYVRDLKLQCLPVALAMLGIPTQRLICCCFAKCARFKCCFYNFLEIEHKKDASRNVHAALFLKIHCLQKWSSLKKIHFNCV